MKLRTLIFAALVVVSVLPVGMLAYRQHKTVVDNEFSVVENQHKVMARNLAIALERYATDLKSAFRMTTQNLHQVHKLSGLEQHLSELFFQHVCSIDAKGNIQQQQCALACPQGVRFPEPLLAAREATLRDAASRPDVLYSAR